MTQENASMDSVAPIEADNWSLQQLLRLGLLSLPSLTVVMLNTIFGALSPILAFPADEVILLDGIWRIVQGQTGATDFYNPLGFGVFQLAAALWPLAGVASLRLAIGLFALVIVLCANVIAARRDMTPLYLVLFGSLVAFIASAPFAYGWGATAIASSAFYNRLATGAVAVLFVQAFTEPTGQQTSRPITEALCEALLLEILFLTKFSNLAIGGGIILAGALMSRAPLRTTLANLATLAVLFGILVGVSLLLSGNHITDLLRDYRLAASGRAENSINTIAAFSQPLLLGSLLLLPLAARGDHSQRAPWRALAIVGAFYICQLLLNLTNTQPPTSYLLPVAAIALWHGMSAHLRRAPTLRKWLGAFTVQEAIVLALSGLVLFPHVESLARSGLLAFGGRVGRAPGERIVISAGNGVALRMVAGLAPPVRGGDYAATIVDGIRLLQSYHVAHLSVATLDFSNPFPVFLQSPSPRGTALWWDFRIGRSLPLTRRFDWPTPLGDACIVMVPLRPYMSDSTDFLLKGAGATLAQSFQLLADDGVWRMYQRDNEDCGYKHDAPTSTR